MISDHHSKKTFIEYHTPGSGDSAYTEVMAMAMAMTSKSSGAAEAGTSNTNYVYVTSDQYSWIPARVVEFSRRNQIKLLLAFLRLRMKTRLVPQKVREEPKPKPRRQSPLI